MAKWPRSIKRVIKLPDYVLVTDYNAFIAWAWEKPGTRNVEIKTNGKQISVWVSEDNDEEYFGGYVETLEEISELKERKTRRELAEYERLKAKFELAKGETNFCDTCKYNLNCPVDTLGYDADGNPMNPVKRTRIIQCCFYQKQEHVLI
jgi:hypothetical protein